MLQTVASLTSVVDDISQAKAKTNETFIVQASLTIVTYDLQNIFIVQATGKVIRLFQFNCLWFKFNFYDFECNMISRLYVITNHAFLVV